MSTGPVSWLFLPGLELVLKNWFGSGSRSEHKVYRDKILPEIPDDYLLLEAHAAYIQVQHWQKRYDATKSIGKPMGP